MSEQYKCLTCGGKIVFVKNDNGYAHYKCVCCNKTFTLKMR